MGVGLAMACFVGFPAASFADDTDADRARCKASYERAQVFVRDERLEAARAQLLICEQTCPAELVTDCKKWRRDVDALTPAIRIVVRDARGRTLTDVRLTEDGRPLEGAPDAPIAIEPGSHVLVAERAGYSPAVTRFDVHAGERDRTIVVVLVPLEATAPAEPRPSATPSYVVGGIGVAALVASAVLGIKGHMDRSSLRSSCAPTCGGSAVDAIATEWWIAAALGVAGATAIGVSIVLWPSSDLIGSSPTPQVTLAPRAFTVTWRL